jgi:tetratricopeptide (TPR) repeat protein
MIARLRGQPDRADPMFRRAIGLDPNYATAHHWYSRMLEDLGRRDEAVAQAQRALELDPLSAIVNKNLGDSLQYRGDFEAALARYRKAIEIDPSMPGPYINIGALNAYALGRISDGVPYVEKAIALDPGSPDYAFGLALQLLDLGADVQAIPLIDAAQKRWPADAGVNMLSAAVHLYRGDQGAAVRFARQALETAPGSGEALAVLRNADLDRGEYVAALARYAKEYPKLVGPEELAIDGSNYAIAIEVVPVLQSMGDTNRAGMLLDRSEQVLRTIPRLGPSGYGIADVRVLALRGETKAALLALREAAQAGWRGPWLRYARDFDPSLAAIRTEPEFKAVFADIGRDMARQRAELAKRPRDAPLDLAAVQ